MLSHLLLTAGINEISTIGDAALAALTGYGVVFGGIVVLMVVIVLLGKLAGSSRAPVRAPEPPVEAPVAPGAAGSLKLHDVEPKTAAMLMAIVADKMGKPINELRFISIKEVK